MLPKLTRILLALVTAFVFTGQMEAAAEHCARLAHEAASAQASKAAAPCHETAAAVASTHHNPTSEASHHPPSHEQAPSSDHCECVAALHGFTKFSGALTSGHVVPYAWLPTEPASFASSRPDPDLRPPRA